MLAAFSGYFCVSPPKLDPARRRRVGFALFPSASARVPGPLRGAGGGGADSVADALRVAHEAADPLGEPRHRRQRGPPPGGRATPALCNGRPL